MKTDNRPTTPTRDQGQRVAVGPSTASVPVPAAAADGHLSDAATLEAELQQIAREEEALRKRRDERGQEYWRLSLAKLSEAIESLIGLGYDRAEIGKHLGFGPAGKTAAIKKPAAAGGPKTYDGWYALFLKNGVQLYYRAHPDQLATLKASGVTSDQYASHISPADLKGIEATAREKAQAKCPQTAEVVSK